MFTWSPMGDGERNQAYSTVGSDDENPVEYFFLNLTFNLSNNSSAFITLHTCKTCTGKWFNPNYRPRCTCTPDMNTPPVSHNTFAATYKYFQAKFIYRDKKLWIRICVPQHLLYGHFYWYCYFSCKQAPCACKLYIHAASVLVHSFNV